MSASLRRLAHRVALTRVGGGLAAPPSPEEARRLLVSCQEGLGAVMDAHWEGRVTDEAAHDSREAYFKCLAEVCSELRTCSDRIWEMAGTFGRSVRKPDPALEGESWL